MIVKKKELLELLISLGYFFNIDSLPTFFNMQLKEVLKNLRNKRNFILNGKLVKVYVYKKEKFIESRGKRK